MFVVRKLFEKEILSRIKNTEKEMKCRLKFSFTEEVTPLTAAVLITEATQDASNEEK